MKKKWICLFSQTGGEIVELAKQLGRWPDLIITNQRPKELRTINQEIIQSNLLQVVSNKPTTEELSNILEQYEDPIITLHGWLRIIPPELCGKYNIFNGHPGLITLYPALKGKDPQLRALKAKHPVMGCVLHKVTAGVDEGEIIMEERFNAVGITEEKMWQTTRDRSLSMWIKFLKAIVV